MTAENRLSINQWSMRTTPCEQFIGAVAAAGIESVGLWRQNVAEIGTQRAARLVQDAGLRVSSLCRGGFLTAATPAGRRAALDDNRRAIDEARQLEAPCLLLVVGSLPGALTGSPAYHDIARARNEVRDGIAASLEYARQVGMPLAIEPLHPMQAAERACINTLEQALDLCDELDPGQTGMLGVAADLYHIWWDPKLQSQIERAGAKRLLAYHVCDWLTPTRDLLNDRGMMGDGVIELKKCRQWMEHAGYQGFAEVEIFSEHWWSQPGEVVLDTCIARHKTVV